MADGATAASVARPPRGAAGVAGQHSASRLGRAGPSEGEERGWLVGGWEGGWLGGWERGWAGEWESEGGRVGGRERKRG